MPRPLQRFIKWLYIHFVDPDTAPLVREQLLLAKGSVDFKTMTDEARTQFLKDCAAIYDADAFHKVIDDLTIEQKDLTMLQATHTDQFLAGRLSIFGQTKVKDVFKSYHAKYQEVKKTGKPYDPFAIV